MSSPRNTAQAPKPGRRERTPVASAETKDAQSGLEPRLRALEKENAKLRKTVRREGREEGDAPSIRAAPPARPTASLNRPPPVKRQDDVIRDVCLRQNGCAHLDNRLQAREPFLVQTLFHLPVVPSSDNVHVDTNAYEVRVLVRDLKTQTLICEGGVAEGLTLGVLDYDAVVKVPGLEPGAYLVNVFAIVPFARVAERKTVPVVVANP